MQTTTKFGQLLVQHRVITLEQLAFALKEQQRLNANSKRKFKLGEILLFSKMISVQEMYAYLLQQKPNPSQAK